MELGGALQLLLLGVRSQLLVVLHQLGEAVLLFVALSLAGLLLECREQVLCVSEVL